MLPPPLSATIRRSCTSHTTRGSTDSITTAAVSTTHSTSVDPTGGCLEQKFRCGGGSVDVYDRWCLPKCGLGREVPAERAAAAVVVGQKIPEYRPPGRMPPERLQLRKLAVGTSAAGGSSP